jgi:hypothetical protein
MIRILFGSALSILGLTTAVAVFGSDLVTGPRGEPLVVAAPGAAHVQQASFDGMACPPVVDFAKPRAADDAHVVTLSFHYGPDGMMMSMAKGAKDTDADAALLLVFDDSGRIEEVTYPPSMRGRMLADAYAAGCLESTAAKPAGI